MHSQFTPTLTQTQPLVIWLESDQARPITQTQQPIKKQKAPKRSVQWTEDTVDNELLNRLKSNICCIYHKPHEEQSQSSSTCTSDDETNHLERDRSTKKKHKVNCSKKTNHDNQDGKCAHSK